LAAAPQPRLRSLLPRGYAGFTEATTPRRLVLPATTSAMLQIDPAADGLGSPLPLPHTQEMMSRFPAV
jgi:hypothetical protein